MLRDLQDINNKVSINSIEIEKNTLSTNELKDIIGTSNPNAQDFTSLFEWTDGGCICAVTNDKTYKLGDIVSSSKYAYSNFVDLELANSLDILTVQSTTSSSIAGICFYDNTKKAIEGIKASSGLDVMVASTVLRPENAKYIRTSVYKDNKQDFYCRETSLSGILKDIDELKKNKVTNITKLILEEPDGIIATAWNYILKKESVDEQNYLCYSDDLGQTWVRVLDTYGDIVYVHFFSEGSILFATMSKCYYSNDSFATINESEIFDYDGSKFIPVATEHFFQNDQSRNEMMIRQDGVEYVVWGDYAINDVNFIPRVWYSEDYGKTVKCIIKFGETQIGSAPLSVRHVHGAIYNPYDKKIYIITGDSGSECALIVGDYEADKWSFELIGQGCEFKFGDIIFRKDYAFFVTDYTVSMPKGILRCRYDKINQIEHYKYIAEIDYSGSLITFLSDSKGNKLLFPDSGGRGKIWYCRDNFKFSELPISENVVLTNVSSPNYNGDIYVRKSLSTYPFKLDPMINLTKSMRNSGCIDFFSQDNIFGD